jgi:uncharacterized protein (DUF779 family)
MPIARVDVTPDAAETAAHACKARHGRAGVPSVGRVLRWQRPDVLTRAGDLRIGARDVNLGDDRGCCEVYIGAQQWANTGSTPAWSRSTSCRGGARGFSLEAPEGVRFLTRSCVVDP